MRCKLTIPGLLPGLNEYIEAERGEGKSAFLNQIAAFGDVGDIQLMFDQRSRTFFKKYETNKPLSWQKEVNTHE